MYYTKEWLNNNSLTNEIVVMHCRQIYINYIINEIGHCIFVTCIETITCIII